MADVNQLLLENMGDHGYIFIYKGRKRRLNEQSK